MLFFLLLYIYLFNLFPFFFLGLIHDRYFFLFGWSKKHLIILTLLLWFMVCLIIPKEFSHSLAHWIISKYKRSGRLQLASNSFIASNFDSPIFAFFFVVVVLLPPPPLLPFLLTHKTKNLTPIFPFLQPLPNFTHSSSLTLPHFFNFFP